MGDEELLRGCRVGVPADDALRAAVLAGASEYADTGTCEAQDLAQTYSIRTRHLAQEGLLLVDEAATLADLRRLGAEAEARLVVRIAQADDHRVVYTALIGVAPPNVLACLVHRLNDE